MMTNRTGVLTANYAAYNCMNSANSLRALSFGAGNSASLLSQENRYRTSMLNDGVNYKAGLLMQETNDKITKDNIKRTFSTFA